MDTRQSAETAPLVEAGHRPDNIGLGATQITPEIRVSSAAIFYDEWFGDRWQVETWIFSHDARQRNVQVIHGSSSYCGGNPPHPNLVAKCQRVHQHIAKNLQERFLNLPRLPVA